MVDTGGKEGTHGGGQFRLSSARPPRPPQGKHSRGDHRKSAKDGSSIGAGLAEVSAYVWAPTPDPTRGAERCRKRYAGASSSRAYLAS